MVGGGILEKVYFTILVERVGRSWILRTIRLRSYACSSPAAGVLDWRTSDNTRGTGFASKPAGCPDIANGPRLLARELNSGPIESNQLRRLGTHVLSIDQRVTSDGFAQLGYFRIDHDAEKKNTESRATDYRVDVNRLRPIGQSNPASGQKFADIDQPIQDQENRVEAGRSLRTDRFDWAKTCDLKQRFSAMGGFLSEFFKMGRRRMRRVDHAAVPLVTGVRNSVRDCV